MKKEFELILDATHDAMIAVNNQGIITLFNKAAGLLTGRDPAMAIGKPIEEVVDNTRLPLILKTGISELNQRQILRDTTIITNRMPVRDEHNTVVGAIAVFRDITEVQALAEEVTNLKEMQGMLAAVFNATQDAISVVDENGIGVMINPAYTRITGYNERDVIGKHCTVDLSEGESVHLKVLSTRKPIKGARLKTGPNRREVIVEAAPIIVNDVLKGSVAVIHDISELNRLATELQQAKQIIRNLEAKYTFDDIIGKEGSLMSSVEKAKMAAETPATIILRGESGTGKELFAHAIHNASERKYCQFVRVNCAAINESTLESELFGYEEGAFTGASKGGKVGLFEQADRGTIFLDEIGEISLNMQAKLLRVLQEKEIVRVGGTKPVPIDVRVISATNVDLEKAVTEGRFRKDLYYRLNVIPITISPLRERKEDLGKLVTYLVHKFNQEYGRMVQDISEEALELIEGYDWPGNVRELENFVGRAIINMRISEKTINSSHLPILEQRGRGERKLDKMVSKTLGDLGSNGNAGHSESLNSQDGDEVSVPMTLTLDKAIETVERKLILSALKRTRGNREEAAALLDLSLRNLYYKMKKYGIR